MTQTRYGECTVDSHLRPDLVTAHHEAWDALGLPGTWWTGPQRLELASTALRALTEAETLAPWTAPSTIDDWLPADRVAPSAAHDAVYRISAHAATLSESWYQQMSDELGDLAYVELVALSCTVAAVVTFRRAAGLAPWELPPARSGEPSRLVPAGLASAELNWVRVAAPPDQVAAVVQAFTSVPAEQERLWMLASAQYIPNLEMVDPRWTRGTLSRPQIELVAARISQLRECFY